MIQQRLIKFKEAVARLQKTVSGKEPREEIMEGQVQRLREILEGKYDAMTFLEALEICRVNPQLHAFRSSDRETAVRVQNDGTLAAGRTPSRSLTAQDYLATDWGVQ